jgi:hypothetical protein
VRCDRRPFIERHATDETAPRSPTICSSSPAPRRPTTHSPTHQRRHPAIQGHGRAVGHRHPLPRPTPPNSSRPASTSAPLPAASATAEAAPRLSASTPPGSPPPTARPQRSLDQNAEAYGRPRSFDRPHVEPRLRRTLAAAVPGNPRPRRGDR